MPLYSYTKAPVHALGKVRQSRMTYKPDYKRPTTVWDLVASFVTNIQELLVNSKFIGALIPVIMIVAGLSMIYQQFWPDFKEYIKLQVDYYDTSTIALASEGYIEREKYLSNPGAEYFQNLTTRAFGQEQLVSDPVSNDYQGTFKLSIPSVELNDINVSANVESSVEAIYDSYLVSGLAHFNGTGLPVSDVENNIVVYGHSAAGNYYDRTKDVAASFSVLKDVKVGDIVEVEMDGQMYDYRVTKSKIVQPDDISIITGQPGKETLTLFTCYPNGNSANRFVVVARPA